MDFKAVSRCSWELTLHQGKPRGALGGAPAIAMGLPGGSCSLQPVPERSRGRTSCVTSSCSLGSRCAGQHLGGIKRPQHGSELLRAGPPAPALRSLERPSRAAASYSARARRCVCSGQGQPGFPCRPGPSRAPGSGFSVGTVSEGCPAAVQRPCCVLALSRGKRLPWTSPDPRCRGQAAGLQRFPALPMR